MNRLSTVYYQPATVKALRFKRWSRKAYAAFISIQRAVTIGCLSANVSERFQVKNGSVHTSVLLEESNSDYGTREKQDPLKEEKLQETGIYQQLLVVLSVQTARQCVAPAITYTLNNRVPKEREIQLYAESSALFVCVKTRQND